MAYQVTMDRTLSDTDYDRLIQSELSRRKYNTIFSEESDEEFKTKFKESIDEITTNFPSGRWRCIRWQDEPTEGRGVNVPRMNPDDPLLLEAHPTDNTCPIIFASYCYPVNAKLNSEDQNKYSGILFPCLPAMTEEIQRDWEMNGNTGDFRETCGNVDFAMWNTNPDTGETSRDIVHRWRILPHDKGFCREDYSKISLVPMIEYFKSVGVTHHGYFGKGKQVKRFAQQSICGPYTGEFSDSIQYRINGQDRTTSPSDFPYPFGYGTVDDDTQMFFPQFLNCEDLIQNGPEHIRDYGWPGTK